MWLLQLVLWPQEDCSLQAYGFLARSRGAVKPHAAISSYMPRWLKAHLYTVVMLLALSAQMVPFSPVSFSCEVLCVMPDCSEDKETNLDWLNTDTSDAYSKMYQNKGSDPLISVIK